MNTYKTDLKLYTLIVFNDINIIYVKLYDMTYDYRTLAYWLLGM